MTRARVITHLPLLIACALMAWQEWMLFRIAAAEAPHVTWTCAVSTCGTNDLAGAAPVMATGVAVALGFLLRRYLGPAVPGVVVAVAGAAVATGWRDAVAAGDVRPEEPAPWIIGRISVENWIVLGQAVTVAGTLAALWGGWITLRRTNALHRIALGRSLAVAEARLTGWDRVGRDRGRVSVTFEDATGAGHSFPAVVGRRALSRTVYALYDADHPGDAASSRVSVSRKARA